MTIRTIKKTIGWGNPNIDAAINTSTKLSPATVNKAIPHSIKTNKLVNRAFRLKCREKNGNSDVPMIPKKTLIVEKIENAFGPP